jgi:hypothetical protein
MKPAQSLLFAAASLAAVAFLACSSGSSPLPTGISDPADAIAFAGTVPSELPTDCFAGDYYAWESGGPCQGTTYLLCDGRTWNQYACNNPSTASDPWYEFTLAAGGGRCNLDDECVGGGGCDMTTESCLPPSLDECASDYCCSSDYDCGTGGVCDTATHTCE